MADCWLRRILWCFAWHLVPSYKIVSDDPSSDASSTSITHRTHYIHYALHSYDLVYYAPAIFIGLLLPAPRWPVFLACFALFVRGRNIATVTGVMDSASTMPGTLIYSLVSVVVLIAAITNIVMEEMHYSPKSSS